MQIERQKVKNMEEENVGINYPQFKPFHSVGDFIFEDDIKNYKEKIKNFIKLPRDKFGDDHYDSPDGNMSITVEKNKILSVLCFYELYFNSINLIGLNLEEFKNITKSDYVGNVDKIDVFDDGNISYIYEFDSIGAQVWMQDNKIVSITAISKNAYSDEPCWD